MTPETLAALRGSIAKWRAIVDGTGTDHGTDNCPLCEMFYYRDSVDDERNLEGCDGCPVRTYTGETECIGTPYSEWSRLTRDQYRGVGVKALTKVQQAAAQAELEFLISLLPEGEAP